LAPGKKPIDAKFGGSWAGDVMIKVPELLERAFAKRVSLPVKETARLLGIDQKTLRGHVKARTSGLSR